MAGRVSFFEEDSGIVAGHASFHAVFHGGIAQTFMISNATQPPFRMAKPIEHFRK